MSNEKLIHFFSAWLANSITLLLIAAIFTGNVVLGNDKVSASMAAVLTGFIITVLSWLIEPGVKRSGYTIKNRQAWTFIYLAANLIIVWLIKRFALLFGLGVSGLLYVGVVGIILTLVQWSVWANIPKVVKKIKVVT